MLKVKVESNQLTFVRANPAVTSRDPGFRLVFQRTLRIPDDGKTYPLPPGMGAFPIRVLVVSPMSPHLPRRHRRGPR